MSYNELFAAIQDNITERQRLLDARHDLFMNNNPMMRTVIQPKIDSLTGQLRVLKQRYLELDRLWANCN